MEGTSRNNNNNNNHNLIRNGSAGLNGGVVINIAAGGHHQVNSSTAASSSSSTPSAAITKPSRRVRRDASFRLPAFLGGSKRSVNGSVSPGSSRRAPSPSSLSSASSSSSNAFLPSALHNNNNNRFIKPTLDVHKHPESVRAGLAQPHPDYSSSSSSSSSSGSLRHAAAESNNTVHVKVSSVAGDPRMSETYKSLGDVFGINAAVASVASAASKTHQPHLKSARSVSNVLNHQESMYPTHRLSTYANVQPTMTTTTMAAGRFGSNDSRASYNERLSVNRQPTQPTQHQQQQLPQRQSSISSGTNTQAFPTGRRPGPPNTPSTSSTLSASRSIVYKSNSSLDLDHDVDIKVPAPVAPMQQQDYHQLRREYGSQGSINISGGNRFSTMAYDVTGNTGNGYRERIYSNPVVELGQPSPGPAAVSTLQRKTLTHVNGDAKFASTMSRDLNKSEESTLGSVISNGSRDAIRDQSGETKKKGSGTFFSKDRGEKSQKSLFKKLRGSKDSSSADPSGVFNKESTDGTLDRQALLDDCHRRRFFLHHDIGSMCARLSGVANQIKMLERKNTTTGASAASAALRNNGSTGGDSPDSKDDIDHGDGISNELVLSCPYFRNEIGGEPERVVALTKETAAKRFQVGLPASGSSLHDQLTHIPAVARGFSLIDTPETFWKQGFCPYRLKRIGSTNIIERIDLGANYYKKFFYGQDHQNWFGTDENLGPVAVSIRREKVPAHPNASELFLTPRNLDPDKDFRDQFMYRLMVRTSDIVPLRGCVLEESIPSLRAEKIKGVPTKEVLDFICPELQLSSLHLGIQSGPCEDQLIRLDEAYLQNKYKVGLMYCREGQQTEEDMYNNEDGGPAFNEFLELIGQKIRLKGFNKYKAGLCSKNDSTGLYSVYTEHEGNEIMFHVSTLLPFTPNNRQQLPRKRYIGNDIVTVVFQEPGARPFIPNIKSQFQHVFIVVRVFNPCTDHTTYSVAVSRSKSVPMFGPAIPADGKFTKTKTFVDFLLTKIINAENAAHRSDKFVSMAIRTRQELLKDLASNYITQTTLDSGSKFNLFPTKKKDKGRPRFSPDTSGQRGAISWRVVAEDCSTRHEVEAFLGISPDTIILVQDNLHRDILFLTATKSVVGWTALQNSIRIFFHQGEALILHSKDWETEDMSEIAQRLKSVTNGAPTQEFTLRRNHIGQLGFHVQHDGLITEVENFGYAWQTGLRQGSRLVEILKTPVNALSHEQMVELLKTSMSVTVTVIPPHPDGSPRRGCNLQNCPYFNDDSGDYENVTTPSSTTSKLSTSVDRRTNAITSSVTSTTEPARSFSPPRSSNSSGYGTGSSRKSIGDSLTIGAGQVPLQQQQQLQQQKSYFPPGSTIIYDGSMPSFSSGQSSDEQRWYEDHPISSSENSSPPPLPNRIGSGKNSAFQRVATGQHGNDSPQFGNTAIAASSSSSNSSPSIYQCPPPPRSMKDPPAFAGNGTPATRYTPSAFEGTYGKTSAGRTYVVNSPKTLSSNFLEEKRSGDARVTYLTEYELSQGKNSEVDNSRPEFLQHERLTALKTPSSTGVGSSKSSDVSSHSPELIPNTSDQHHQHHHQLQQRSHPPLSEDDLSGISVGSSSPQQIQKLRSRTMDNLSNGVTLTRGDSLTPASSSVSRDQSPRMFLSNEPSTAAKLKRPVARNSTNRNSTNLGSSTLQEDLMKLIGPDFEATPKTTVSRQDSKSPSSDYSSVSVVSTSTTGNNQGHLRNSRKMSLNNDLHHLMRSRSRENIAAAAVGSNAGNGSLARLNSTTLFLSSPPDDGRDFHMARPATVISNPTSVTSSPADAKNISGSSRKDSGSLSSTPSPYKKMGSNNMTQMVIINDKSEGLPPMQQQQQPIIPLPDDQDMDWPSLVNTASRVISVNGEDSSNVPRGQDERDGARSMDHSSSSKSRPKQIGLAHLDSDLRAELKGLSKGDVSQLLEKVSLLETRLTSEEREKIHLAEEVAALREENLRLQEESQTAAQQLKKFTDWFFQAIDNS